MERFPMGMEMGRQFLASGGVFPRGWPPGRSELSAECLIEGAEPSVEVSARFAQAVERHVFDAAGEPIGELVVTDRCYSSGRETIEREVRLSSLPNRAAAIRTAGGEQMELAEDRAVAGTLAWRWEPLHATVEAWIEEIEPGLHRVRVDVANRLEWNGEPPERVPLRTLHATHVFLHSPDGAFVSLIDPPSRVGEQAAACHSGGLWPVPIGEAGDRRTMLAAPIRLEDYPRIGSPRPQASRAPYG
jgi:hypothetical protein